jgi:LPS-assembly protein
MSQFEGGAWLDLTAGHSLFLAGTNAFTFADPAVTGAGSGLETASSYLVAGARMGIPGLTFGGKLQFDPNTARFTRAAAIASATLGMVTLSGDYTFRAANAAIGQITDQHDAGGRLAVTIEDYWTASAAVNWDIRLGQMTDHTLALQYDDGYLLYGLSYTATGPNALAPLSQNVLFSITLKGPRGKVVGSRVGVNQAGVSDFGLDL